MTDWRSPPALQHGDTIAIISPSGPVQPRHLEVGLDILRQWGFTPDVHQDVFAVDQTGYLAGDDQIRLDMLRWAIEHPSAKAILCARGGYGAMRLLPKVSPLLQNNPPKQLVGFSDITALHLAYASCANLTSLHGPVLKSFAMLQDDQEHDSLGHLRRALCGQRGTWSMTDLTPVVHAPPVTGRLIGGNLSLVASLVGSPYCPDLRDKILFLEDVTESDYRLDRLLYTIWLSHGTPRGVVLGDFTSCGGVYVDHDDIPAYLADQLKAMGCPVAMGAPFGHAHRNVTIKHGAVATLDTHAGTLTFEESPS